MRSQLLTSFLFSLAFAQNHASRSSSASSSASTGALYSEFGVLEFDNFGFEGYFRNVKKLDSSSKCECELAANNERTLFSGPNSPMDKGVSVHFRGPLVLKNFAFYNTDNFTLGSSGGSDWTRRSYYDGTSKSNATFLTAAGENSTCLGKALTYAASNGVSSAGSDTLLAQDTLIGSDEQFILFSNVSCKKSGFGEDCGVYRDGIPAYHGFDGVTKLFLFEFEMPEETSKDKDSFEFYNMPAIWLLNDHIPRTSQFPTNENCSCWATGCGEFDIFEVMNTTEANHLYSTIHDYQGSGDIGTGIQAKGWIQRNTTGSMKGGVVFGSNGQATVFVNNDIKFDSSLPASSIRNWVADTTKDDRAETNTLASATNTGSGKVNAAGPGIYFAIDFKYLLAGLAVATSVLFF